MAKRPRIAVVGSANIDLTTFTAEFPKPGQTIFGQKFDLGFGGKGANQAVAARLCGAEVFMVARVGSDLFGPATIENFKKLGIDASQVKQVEGLSSGVAPIFVDPHGQNRILVVKGANDALKPEPAPTIRAFLYFGVSMRRFLGLSEKMEVPAGSRIYASALTGEGDIPSPGVRYFLNR